MKILKQLENLAERSKDQNILIFLMSVISLRTCPYLHVICQKLSLLVSIGEKIKANLISTFPIILSESGIDLRERKVCFMI